MATPDWAWQRDAACRGDDVWLFFGLDGERGDAKAQREREAKKVCAQCPVRNECLSYAVETRQVGFWGGLNDEQRQSDRRRRQRRASATAPTVDDKNCRDCGETKLATEFHKDKRSRDGLVPYCRTCDVARRQRDTVEAVA